MLNRASQQFCGISVGLATTTALAVALVCCGSGNSYVGLWQGQTSQGANVTFTVQKNKTVFCFEFGVEGSAFGTLSPGCNSTTSPPDTVAINGNSFVIDGDGTFQGAGQFMSYTQASGTIDITGAAPPFNISWTATKQ